MKDKSEVMARIPLVEFEDASDEVKAIYGQVEELGFPILNVFKLFGNDVGFLGGFVAMISSLYADDSPLQPRYRELAWLRASQLNACHY
ncbi:MAG TPA: hypothetical protein EYQ81_03765 [Sneathiellales bacterium]|jgi:alkylhydroperoxidase family enzyme|nr:hypothetical protein [Sneathiellales bacterium]